MNPKKTRVFITVKTYPTLSAKYDELVCTAGITEEGKWVRIYPVPFRKLQWEKQYKKYQWIELEVIRNKSDFRLESYRPTNQGQTIQSKEFIRNWEDRKRIISKAKIYKDLNVLIKEAKNKKTSLAIFKPEKPIGFKCESVENRKWNSEKIKIIKEKEKQLDLFNSDKPHEIFKIVKKLPYKFSYVFKDKSGKESKLMIEDWEIGALYWNCLKREKDEKKAIQKVRNKYLDEFNKKKDLYLFLGTTKKFHNVAPNPFVIIGVFYPPVTHQMSLL